MLNVIKMSVIVQNAVNLSDVVLNVVEPFFTISCCVYAAHFSHLYDKTQTVLDAVGITTDGCIQYNQSTSHGLNHRSILIHIFNNREHSNPQNGVSLESENRL
jgi:hypothetical protein